MEYIIEIISMFFLSLWKVYIGYSYFAIKSYSFLTASTIIISAVFVSISLSLLVYKQMKDRKWFIKFRLSKNYNKGMVFYNKYGFYTSLLLSPVLLGIPVFCLLSFALNIDKIKVISGVFVSTLIWGAIIYISIHYSISFW